MEYHIPISNTVEISAGRRLAKPLDEIPMVYRAKHLKASARYINDRAGSRYVFDINGQFAERLENNEITAKFAYDTWVEQDRSKPNCRIAAILFEDRR